MTKTSCFRLLLAVMICTALIAVFRGDAATYKASTWMSPYNNGWEHDEKTYMNDWHYQSGSRQMVFTYYEGTGAPVQAVYCIAPTNARTTGAALSEFDESYITNYSWNTTISGAAVRDLLSYVLYYGYVGQVWEKDSRVGNVDMSDPDTLRAFDEALATQMVVWEVIVGERKADFSKQSAGNADTVLSTVQSSMPGYASYFLPKYNEIVNGVVQMLGEPSFLRDSQADAVRNKMQWDGSQYILTLTDTNHCLEGWSFTAEGGLNCSVNGDKLIITAESLPDSGDLLITASRTVTGRSMLIQTSSAAYSLSQTQPTVVPGTVVSSAKTRYVKAYGDAWGCAEMTKLSSDPAVTDGNSCYSTAGILYGVYTASDCMTKAMTFEGNEAEFTLKADGSSNTLKMHPGTYYVKEISVPAGSGYQLDTGTVKTVTVLPNETASVSFTDVPLDDPAGVIIQKTDENGNVLSGADMSGARYELKFYGGQYTKSDLPSEADAVWILETKKVGSRFYAQLSDAYRVAGDTAKYGKNADGAYRIPLGTLTIREILAPDGFRIEGSTMQLAGGNGSDADTGLILLRIIDQNSAVFVRSGNQLADSSAGFEILQKEQRIPVTAQVRKVDPDGAPIPGVVFNLRCMDPDGTLRDHPASSDSLGLVSWSGLLYGTEATLYEVSAPDGYRPDPSAVEGITKTLTGTPDSSGTFYLCVFDDVINEEDGGKVTVRKSSEGPTLAGFCFVLSGTSALGQNIRKTAVTDSAGTADFGFIPTGSYTVSETDVPSYMSVSPASHEICVESTDVEVSFTNRLKTGSVHLLKAVPGTSSVSPEGFLFRLSGTSEAGTGVNMTAVTDPDGKAVFSDVPYGTYEISEELTEEQAALWIGKEKEQVTVDADHTSVSYRLLNEPLCGTVEIVKAVPAGSAVSPEGFLFRLSGTSDIGTFIDMTAATDSAGKASFLNVPFGTYEILEELTEAQAAVWEAKDREQITVSAVSQTVSYTLVNQERSVPVKVVKLSDDGTVAGFCFTISGIREIGGTFEKTVCTDAEGRADFGEVPFGSYTVTEEPHPAYLNDGPWHFELTADSASPFTIRACNSRVRIETLAEDAETHLGICKADGSVLIKDTVSYSNLTPGTSYQLIGTVMDAESDEALTDKAGSVIRASDTFSPETSDGTFEMFFSFDAEELTGKKLVIFEELYRNGELLAEHKDLTDDAQTIYLPRISTHAKEETGGINHTAAGTTIRITDTVTYEKLRPGLEYVVSGILMDQQSGDPVQTEGGAITAEAVFIADTENGSVSLTFAFDASALGGRPIVVFERIFCSGTEVAAHTDPEDENQIIYIPAIRTTAVFSDTRDHLGRTSSAVTVLDTVACQGLETGREYTVSGILMDKATGRPFIADGAEITAETAFTANTPEDCVELIFSFAGDQAAGKILVVFETLYTEGSAVAVHADWQDENQTVYMPEITTNAKDKSSGTDHAQAGRITILDTVTYHGLLPGREYRLCGCLMDRESGEPLCAGGETVTAELSFTPENSDGTVLLPFVFDASALAGRAVVVYESLYFKDFEVAAHADLKDENQTVYIPKLTTAAVSQDTGSHIASADAEVVILDSVTCRGLKAGNTYSVEGILMNKTTGRALLADDGEVTASAVFTAEKSVQTVELTFRFNGTGLEGTTVVAFETLYTEDSEVAAHTDMEDEDQSVQFPGIRTMLRDQKTQSDHTNAEKEAILLDTVYYAGLIPGKTYTLKGVLVKRADGEVLPVTAEKDFIPERGDGETELVFTLDASCLAGTVVVAFEALYSDGVLLAVHSDLTDDGQTAYIPALLTKAADRDTGLDHAKTDGDVTVADTVRWAGLKAGKEYRIKGILADKNTGEPLLLNGSEISAEKIFQAEQTDGSIELTFTFDGTLAAGKVLVVFETLYADGQEVARHTDLSDGDQTVYLPAIRTAAADKEGSKIGRTDKLFTIVDRVEYSGLRAEEEYTLEGCLMIADTGEPLLIGGQPVTASLSFRPENADGSAELEFPFDASSLEGCTIVVFEKLIYQGTAVAWHEDPTDPDQQIYFPQIFTNAADASTGTATVTVSETASVIDTVFYKSVEPGRTYRVKGVLTDQESGEAILAGEEEITAEISFTTEKTEGRIELTFCFDATLLRGKKLVIYERLYDEEGREIAAHADPGDPLQTVVIPPEEPTEPDQPKDQPDMGEKNTLLWYSLLSVASVSAIVFLLIFRKKFNGEKDR
ncbi:MAG: VaFE repeat-containing surface-anchored protein [Lachnospiraceae bacterium]|nr:VaFE repeat-containing surface-anchored protein [Lachnospiraceae bacterium]